MVNAEPQEAIRRLRQSYMHAQDASDADGCVSHWDADGVLLPPNEPAVKGTEALLSWYRATFDQFGVAFSITFDEIQVNGDWSFASGKYSGHLVPRSGGEPIADEGKYLEVHRRHADGTWKFARHMWSSDKSNS